MQEQELKQKLKEKAEPVRFRATTGLLGATTLGIGGLMGAGLYVLVGIAAAEAGPGLWLSYAACGGLTFLSVLMFGEFARRLPVSGGGYVYAYRQIGSFWGFLVGWSLALGSIFACALYAYGFATYAATFFSDGGIDPWAVKGVAVGLVAVLLLVGLRGGSGGEQVQRIFTWGNLVVLLVLAAVALPFAKASNFDPMFPRGLGGAASAISLIYISFFGYQLVANNSEEIRDAPRTVPRAMVLAMIVASVFYLMTALVAVAAVDWRTLAASDAPLVAVAARGLGTWGAVLIGIGGILASGAALNGTLLSQGRQIFAMGRDRLLPEALGSVTEGTGVPTPALLLGGATTVLVIVLGDLVFIAKSANFALLFSMLPVSVALHVLYGRRAGEEPVSRWRRVLPWAALAANLALLLTLDRESLFFGGTLIGAGCVVFVTYSYSAEKRGRAGFSIDLADTRTTDLLGRGERVLVPMSNPRTQESLFSVSQALLPPGGGEVVVLSVVPADGEDVRSALQRDSRIDPAVGMIGRAAALADERGVTFRPVVRAARDLAEGIRHAAQEEHCRVVVMGWGSQDDGRPSELLERVTREVKADLVFLQLTHDVAPRRIGVALGARANLPLMVRVAGALAERYEGDVRYLSVVPERFGNDQLRHARETQMEAIGRHQHRVAWSTELIRSDDSLEALVRRSQDLDLLVVGSAAAAPLRGGSVGSFSSLVARRSHCSVVIVRKFHTLGGLLST